MDGLASMDPRFSIYSYNLAPAAYGLKVRNGYREHVTNITGTGGIRTLVPVKGAVSTNDRLFAISADGIWAASASSSTPTKVVTFGTTTGNSGWDIWCGFTTVANQFVAVCDEVNGYYIHAVAANTWTKITLGAGVDQISVSDPTKFVFVMSYKGRLFFIPQDSSASWYLPSGVYYGAVATFEWGDKFPHGGTLVGLYEYSAEGGAGPQSYMIAISSTGDVLAYNGTNPASDFVLIGSWYVGDLPAGRRVIYKSGGELLILTQAGIIPFSNLMKGVDIANEDAYITKNIMPLVRSDMQSLASTRGWEIKINPYASQMIVATPYNGTYKQYIRDLAAGGWGQYRDLPGQTFEAFSGTFYVGGSNGKLYKYTGDQDAITLAGTGAVDINWSILTAFQNAGVEKIKQVDFIKAYFISEQSVAYVTQARYDFALEEISASVAAISSTGSLWDSAVWDSAIWGGAVAATQGIQGAAGLGTYVAIAMKGVSRAPSTLIALGGTAKLGNFM